MKGFLKRLAITIIFIVLSVPISLIAFFSWIFIGHIPGWLNDFSDRISNEL